MRMMFALLTLVLLTPALASDVPVPIRNFPLVSHDGKPFQLHDYKGKYLFVTFIYSKCPVADMCPLTMTLSNRLVRKWKASGKKRPLQVLAVTMDPERDTPAVLRQFGKSHKVDFDHFAFATGDTQVLSDFAAEFNVIGFPSQGTIAHNMKNILLGPDLKPIKEYKENQWKPEEVLKDLETAAKGKKS